MNAEAARRRLIKLTYVAVICAAVYLSVKYLIRLILPFVIALAVAEATRAPADRLSRRLKISRRLCSGAVVTAVIAVAAVLVFFGVRQLFGAAQALISRLPQLGDAASQWVGGVSEKIAALLGESPDALVGALDSAPAALTQSAVKAISAKVADIAAAMPDFFLTAGVSVIAAYLVSADYYNLKDFARKVLRPRLKEKLSAARAIVIGKLGRLCRGYAILLGVTFAELFAGLLLLDVKNALFIAAIIAVVDILPVFGTGTVLVPWAIVAVIQGELPLALGLGGLWAAISVVRNFLEPKIIGAQIKLDPFAVLVCMFVGYKLFGLAGLLLSPLAASVIRELAVGDII